MKMTSTGTVTGTGDGGPDPIIGRKILGFVIYVVLLTVFAVVLQRSTAPENLVVQGMWQITYVGIFVVGGQAAIDTLVPILMRWADAYASARTGKAVASLETKKPGK